MLTTPVRSAVNCSLEFTSYRCESHHKDGLRAQNPTMRSENVASNSWSHYKVALGKRNMMDFSFQPPNPDELPLLGG